MKLTCPGMAGIPDRLILGAGGLTAFVELKALGKTPTALQIRRHEQLRDLGFQVEVVDSPDKAIMIAVTVCG